MWTPNYFLYFALFVSSSWHTTTSLILKMTVRKRFRAHVKLLIAGSGWIEGMWSYNLSGTKCVRGDEISKVAPGTTLRRGYKSAWRGADAVRLKSELLYLDWKSYPEIRWLVRLLICNRPSIIDPNHWGLDCFFGVITCFFDRVYYR